MKQIGSLRDLEYFGIEPLTGEADATGTRCLCDLTAKGRDIFCTAFEILPSPSTFKEQWNPGTKEDPHVASVMLDHACWRTLALFALLLHGCLKVYLCHNGTFVGAETEEEVEMYAMTPCVRSWNNPKGINNDKQVDFRNIHQASGRVS